MGKVFRRRAHIINVDLQIEGAFGEHAVVALDYLDIVVARKTPCIALFVTNATVAFDGSLDLALVDLEQESTAGLIAPWGFA